MRPLVQLMCGHDIVKNDLTFPGGLFNEMFYCLRLCIVITSQTCTFKGEKHNDLKADKHRSR